MRRFFEGRPDYQALEVSYARLLGKPGLGVLTAAPGLGKTRALRHLRAKLAQGRMILHVDGEEAAPEAPWRVLGKHLRVDLSRRRKSVWRAIAAELRVGARLHVGGSITHGWETTPNLHPLLVVDEAQHVSNGFFVDLADFRDAVDRRISVWLVGLPSLAHKLFDRRHDGLREYISEVCSLSPLELDAFAAMIAGEYPEMRAEEIERLWAESKGVPRVATRLLRGKDEP